MDQKRLEERLTVYYYFLQPFGYPVAGKYPKTPNKSEQLLLKEDYPNGAVLHNYWYLQSTPYPVAGSYGTAKKSKKSKREARAVLQKGLSRIENGESALEIVKKIV